MFYLNFKFPKRYIILSLLIFALAVVVFINIVVGIKTNKPTETFTVNFGDVSVEEYISSFGLEIDRNACVIDEITVPYEFGQVYESYNNIQKSQGFDLEQYKGKVLKRYSYPLLNYPDKEKNVFVEVLIFNDSIVAADVYSTNFDGFIIPLK